jgi:uncharacterized protein YeaO (DUF488 family)
LYYIINTKEFGGFVLIYTSYFSSRKYEPKDGVAIARWCSFWPGRKFDALVPSEELLLWWKSLPIKDQLQAEAKQHYENLYREQTLNKLDPSKVAKKLEGKTLLCYEKSEDFCHRHIVAKWLRENGFACEERL